MTSLRTHTDTDRKLAVRSVRDAIALALDGVLPPDDHETAAAYRAATAPLSTAMDHPLQRLRQLSAAGCVSASARFDDTHRLLNALGITPISTCAISEHGSWPGVVFVGCLGTGDAAHNGWIARILARGAIVVSSDRSAGVPIIANGLSVGTRGSARRARMVLRPDLADRLALDAEWGRLVARMHPAVRLAPGHLPLACAQPNGTHTIARDALTDDPLIVHAQVGGGQIVHSVAHWWQDAQPDSTELGRRALASVPAFAELGLLHREARLGGFAAGSVMLACLLAGLDAALDRAGSVELTTGLMTTEGGQLGSSA